MAESVDNSLTDRILRVVSKQETLPEFPADAEDLPSDYEYDPDAEEEIEEVEEISENDLLQFLESERSALSIAKQLFFTEQLENINNLQLQVLSPNDVDTLYNVGAVVVDNVIDPAVIRGANQEAVIMKDNGEFQPAQKYRKEGDDLYRDETARDDQTVWFDPNIDYEQESKQNLNQVLRMLSHGLVQDLTKIIHLNGKVEYQLAYYHPQNARYERHRDAFPVSDQDDVTQRRVTAIVYLNPDWVQGDGGELRIFGKNGEPDHDIEPIASRMVVFLSGVADHAVIAAAQDRYALTAWIR
ncbi:hypothetical protein BGW37DRAFT_499520 [Umbelopsis sp. PMI_123]|nr:hypothetical protein BGW37DRAFT_499520 [Umbelopsis sp. PMI_123]